MSKKKDTRAGGMGLRKPTTRRQFLKVAGIGGLSAASLYLLGCAGEDITTTETVTSTVTSPPTTTTVTAPAVTTTVTAGPADIVWDYEADIVCVGGGATGMIAAIRARDMGADVLIVEQNYDVGGRAICSGGGCVFGGGTSEQVKWGLVDSPDLYFKDMTDWSILGSHGIADYRYNDREMMRAVCNSEVAVNALMMANGVVWTDEAPHEGGSGWGVSVNRRLRPTMDGMNDGSLESPTASTGSALIRPMEASARAKGVRFLLNRHMDSIFRESSLSGNVLGISASYTPRIPPGSSTRLESYRSQGNINDTSATLNIKAKKAVIIGTSGHSGNVPFRRSYDPRMFEHVQMTNQPFTSIRGQDASGIMASLEIGGSCWAKIQMYEHGGQARKRNVIGIQHTYHALPLSSPVIAFAGGTGINIGGAGWGHVVNVNQMGERFFSERGGGYIYPISRPATVGPTIPEPYVHGSWRNTQVQDSELGFVNRPWVDAALQMNAGSTGPDYSSGPIWAIFDAAAVTRREWAIGSENVGTGFFFSGNTLTELAGKIIGNPYQNVAMPGANLEATISRFNSLVDSGVDSDFDRDDLEFKIDTPPFYAAWCAPVRHDSYGGLHVNAKCQAIDRWDNVIPHLYAGGEAVGGWNVHGLTKGFTLGYIAGGEAVLEPSI